MSTAARHPLESHNIVYIQCHHCINSHGLQQLRHIACGHRVARLGLPILACISEIGNDGSHARRATFADRCQEEQEPANFVVGALTGSTMEAVDDVNVAATHTDKRPGLMFAILEFAFFVLRKRCAEHSSHLLAEAPALIQGKNQYCVTLDDFGANVRGSQYKETIQRTGNHQAGKNWRNHAETCQ